MLGRNGRGRGMRVGGERLPRDNTGNVNVISF